MTLVLNNGASINLSTMLQTSKPLKLTQDTTSHPLWTGGDRKLSVKEGQAAKFMQRYAGWGQDEAARQPKVLQEASAQQGQPPRLTG
eukprot:jgi/Astpho2/6055/Aster-x1346